MAASHEHEPCGRGAPQSRGSPEVSDLESTPLLHDVAEQGQGHVLVGRLP
jgi:hypothetical protein